MILNTKQIQKYSKLITSLQSAKDDFIYFDCLNSKMYFSNQKTTVKLDVDIKEADFPILTISKNELLHLMSFETEFTINSDYSYFSKDIKGVFEHNSNYDYVLESLKNLFEDTDDLKTYFNISKSSIPDIIRASIFVSNDDKNPQFRALHINENTISSSSEYRIYYNTFESEFNSIIPHEVIKFIALIDDDMTIYDLESALLLKYSDIEIIFNSFDNVAFLHVNSEQWNDLKQKLLSSDKCIINSEKLSEKLSFIKYYANSKDNKLTHLSITDSKLQLSVDNTFVDVPIEQLNGTMDFYFNSEHLANIIQHLTKRENCVTIYSNNDIKMYLIQLSENELIYVSKINA